MSERVVVVLALTPVAEQAIEAQLFGPGAVLEPRASVAEADELEAAAAAEASVVLLSPALSGLTPGHCTRVRARGLRLIGIALDQREHDALLELGVDQVSEPEPTALIAAINGRDQSQPLPPMAPAPDRAAERRSGSVVAVVGSKGSPGASECAASLAALAARRWSCVLLELDLLGGALDIRLGADAQQGSLLGLLPHARRQHRRPPRRPRDLRLLPADAPPRPRPRTSPNRNERMNIELALLALSFVTGGLLLTQAYLLRRRPALATRLARAEGHDAKSGALAYELPRWLSEAKRHYERELRRAGGGKTARRLLQEKALLAGLTPLVPLLPYAAATGQLPNLVVVLVLALGGFFTPDLVLCSQVRRRKEEIFLDLPEAIAILALSLRAGQSLRQALELAARDCPGALAQELERALTLARRERGLDEREALVRVARESGEPGFARFAELLAVKESPYLDFLRQQAGEARVEQNRYLARAADRAYLSMHAPLAPLLAVLVLLLAYGFLRFLADTV
jgi:tight adherence protein C